MNRSLLNIAEILRGSPGSRKLGNKSRFRNETARTLLVLLVVCTAATVASAGPGNYNQQGPKLVGTGWIIVPPFLVQQGNSVAISADGNTALIGGPSDNGSVGAAWVFARTNGVWTQQGEKLVGTGAIGTATQGGSVALSADGNTAAVGGGGDNGGIGAVWIFIRSGGAWTQQGSKLVGDTSGRPFQGTGLALSADGNTLVDAGSFPAGGRGGVWVFTRSSGIWMQRQRLSDYGLERPVAISADGNTLVGSLPPSGDATARSVVVFTRLNEIWTQQAVLSLSVSNDELVTSSLTANGDTLLTRDQFFYRKDGVWSQNGPQLGAPDDGGSVLSADGHTVIANRYHPSEHTTFQDLFVKVGGTWKLQNVYIGKGGTVAGGGSALAVTANGNTMIESEEFDNNGVGATWVFASPQLFTSLTHSGNFTRGQMGATYTITAKNVGDRAIHSAYTSAVNLVDRLPDGLVATGISGDGWSCTLATLFCTRSDGLAVGATFPPVTVTVNVSSDAPASVTNSATASGGGSRWSTAKDVTNVGP
ncbi:MAG TPA: hypothetical protein VFA76_06680 [Terriglobales bacterium]|nr:hypothetical protein [Terriglobales bacterium]